MSNVREYHTNSLTRLRHSEFNVPGDDDDMQVMVLAALVLLHDVRALFTTRARLHFWILDKNALFLEKMVWTKITYSRYYFLHSKCRHRLNFRLK